MNVADALEKISKALAVLAYQTKAENLTGLFSKNRLTEDLLLPVFRIAFSAPDLRNLNREKANFPDIDLGDDKKRLAIQITTEKAAEKIEQSLTSFVGHDLPTRYDRLVCFILTPDKPRYASKSKSKWQTVLDGGLGFNPSIDIIAINSLFRLIEGLSHGDIFSIEQILSRSVVGDQFVDVEASVERQSRRQLEYEKNSGKYIPDVFVETHETKNLARTFAHPVLFFRRTVESLSRTKLCGPNAFLQKAGLPLLPFPDLAPFSGHEELNKVEAAAKNLAVALEPLNEVLSKYESSRKDNPPFPIKKRYEAFYEQNTYGLQQVGWGTKHRLQDRFHELFAASARVFILTGKAGQGKTNLICDFVENFLWKHGIPCAYISCRRLAAIQSPDIGETFQRLLFEGKTKSFADAAAHLSAYSERAGKPFILIIDGLNEHHRLSEFAEQLEHFIEAVLEHKNLKVFLTCRSEFFQQRFGNLLAGSLGPHTFLLEGDERQHDEEFFDEVLRGYFRFFKIRREYVAKRAIESLKKDILLLRFFCEAYGARGKAADYRQPFISDIYREQIFEIYLERKLGTADAFLRLASGKVDPTAPKAELRSVLEHIIEHMVTTGRFSNAPADLIPSRLSDALYALLDEELILRRDLSPPTGIFSPSTETINFTFDEFRDFLIAQYLVHRTYATSREAFEQFITRIASANSQITEGIKKFLFYLSRRRENGEFWQYYHERSWYMDVYDAEIFNIDPRLLRDEDRHIVIEALEAGGERARNLSCALAVNWHPEDHPVLGLNLLLQFISQTDDDHFNNLVIETFRTIRNFNDGSSAEAFCELITKKVMPQFAPSSNNPESGLFRFLVLLLPVDADVHLNSESSNVFRLLLARHPQFGIDLLRESLQYGPTRHRAHVWRLLASVSHLVSMDDPLLIQAQQDQSYSAGSDQVLHREVSRFLQRILELKEAAQP